MLKLIIKALVITTALMVASLAFADEAILSTLILLTISLTAVSLVFGQLSQSEPTEVSDGDPASWALARTNQARGTLPLTTLRLPEGSKMPVIHRVD